MKKIGKILGIACMSLAVIALASCEDPDDFRTTMGETHLTFDILQANGNAGQTTTMLTLVFSADVTGLTADDITLSGTPAAGVTKGTLTRTALGTYDLSLTGISRTGTLTVTLSSTAGISGARAKIVTVYFAPTGPLPTTFDGLQANGSSGSLTTSMLTLVFSVDVIGLTADHFALSGSPAAGVTKGPLTRTAVGTYNLPLTGISSTGVLTVTLSDDIAISGTRRARSVTVYYAHTGPLPNTLYVFDMRTFLLTMGSTHQRYDYLKLATALQGLANRDTPRIYFYFEDPESRFFYSDGPSTVDKFWLTHLSASGQYLSTFAKNYTKYPPTAAGFFSLIEDFSAFYDGFVVWDINVHATANVASTIAGVDNLLPVPYDTDLYAALFPGRYSTDDIKVNLTNKFTGIGNIPDSNTQSTGSKKNDAYIWAKEQYLDTGKTNPLRMGYCTDSYMRGDPRLFWTTLANADFLIKEKAFFWDLSQDANRIPRDDQCPSTQVGEEVRTLNKLLESQAARANYQIFNVSGFTPWNVKYTTQVEVGYGGPDAVAPMDGVAAEWTLVNRLSRYGGQVEGDANPGVGDVSNLSVLSHVPLNNSFTQKNKGEARYNSITYSSNTSYFTIFMGDYDSASWTSSILSNFWENSKEGTGNGARGRYPLSWVIPTGISPRIPHLFNYLYEHATANDYFVAGDNGTAYLNPTMLESPHLAVGMPGGDTMLLRWEAYNKTLADRFDIQILPFFINTSVATLGTASIPGNVVGSMSRAYPLGIAYTATNGLVANNNWNVYKHTNADNTVTPWIRFLDLLGGTNGENGATPQQIADDIYSKIGPNGNATGRRFYYFRCVLVKPETMNAALDILATRNGASNRMIVDPYTLFRLARENL